MTQYIFGYGSLIDTENRSLTLSLAREVVPVRVQGLRREWNVPSIRRSFTVLGVVPFEGAYCTGVVFPVSEIELEQLDFRERGYDRITIADEVITMPVGQMLSGTVYTYSPQFSQKVNQEYPLAQTYLDIVLRGCLEFGEGFAREFIRTTKGWSEYLVNDRTEPRTRTSIRDTEIEKRIDQLLGEEIPQYFSQRV